MRSSREDCSLRWIKVQGSYVSEGAVKGGHNENQQDIYICRVLLSDRRLIGKVSKEHGTCYVPLGEREVSNPSYEILVAFNSATSGFSSTRVTETSPVLVTNPLQDQDPGRKPIKLYNILC